MPELEGTIASGVLKGDQQLVADAAAQSEQTERERTLTVYEISREVTDVDAGSKTWQPVGQVEAPSGAAAIRGWHGMHPSASIEQSPLRLRAVPTRNITELTVTVEQRTEVKFT